MRPPTAIVIAFIALVSVHGTPALPFDPLAPLRDPADSDGLQVLLLPTYGNTTNLHLQGRLAKTPPFVEQVISGLADSISALVPDLDASEEAALRERVSGFAAVGVVAENVAISATLLSDVSNSSFPVVPARQADFLAGTTDVAGFFDLFVAMEPGLLPEAGEIGVGKVAALQLASTVARPGGISSNGTRLSPRSHRQRLDAHLHPRRHRRRPPDNQSLAPDRISAPHVPGLAVPASPRHARGLCDLEHDAGE
jgi:hypothetical protein